MKNSAFPRFPALRRVISGFVALSFLLTAVLPPASAQTILDLPVPGTMVPLSPAYTPVIMAGMTIDPKDPLQFDFIIDSGDDRLQGDTLRREADKLVRYFMAVLTVPEDDMWVNLSPYEKDRVIAGGLGNTVLGRDMLAQDYLLKQLTASMMYPEDRVGSEFWERVRARAKEKLGTAQIPANTFNKIWIIPERAAVYRQGNSVFVAESRLKVMLEEDYLALEHHDRALDSQAGEQPLSAEMKEVLRGILIPEVEREVNEGKNFAPLRQIYHALILAAWYKKNLKDSLLGRVYINQNKIEGVDLADKETKQKIYDQYVTAFRKGVFNYIREDYDELSKQMIPRKYFSGGENLVEVAKGGIGEVPLMRGDSEAARLAGNRNPDVVVSVKARLDREQSSDLPDPKKTTGDLDPSVERRALKADTRSLAVKLLDPAAEVVSALFHSQRENRIAVAERIKRKTVFLKELGENGIYFQEEAIENPDHFGGIFKEGDKVLKLHIVGTGRKEIKQLIKEGLHPYSRLQMKEAGYAGIYSDPSHRPLEALFLREMDPSTMMRTPPTTYFKRMLTTIYANLFYGYATKGLPRRIVHSFEHLPEEGTKAQQTSSSDQEQSSGTADSAMLGARFGDREISQGDLEKLADVVGNVLADLSEKYDKQEAIQWFLPYAHLSRVELGGLVRDAWDDIGAGGEYDENFRFDETMSKGGAKGEQKITIQKALRLVKSRGEGQVVITTFGPGRDALEVEEILDMLSDLQQNGPVNVEFNVFDHKAKFLRLESQRAQVLVEQFYSQNPQWTGRIDVNFYYGNFLNDHYQEMLVHSNITLLRNTWIGFYPKNKRKSWTERDIHDLVSLLREQIITGALIVEEPWKGKSDQGGIVFITELIDKGVVFNAKNKPVSLVRKDEGRLIDDAQLNPAMLGSKGEDDLTNGGIDFNPGNLDLRQEGEAAGITFAPGAFDHIAPDSVQGLTPVIINITPIPSFLPLLGLSESDERHLLSKS